MTGDLYPVDLSAIPIAAYGFPGAMVPQAKPQNPGRLFSATSTQVQAVISVHWGTFQLTGEHIMGTAEPLEGSGQGSRARRGRVGTLEHGDTGVWWCARTRGVEI